MFGEFGAQLPLQAGLEISTVARRGNLRSLTAIEGGVNKQRPGALTLVCELIPSVCDPMVAALGDDIADLDLEERFGPRLDNLAEAIRSKEVPMDRNIKQSIRNFMSERGIDEESARLFVDQLAKRLSPEK